MSFLTVLCRSEFVYRERFNLRVQDRDLVAEEPGAPPAPAPAPGGPFAVAWRNYVKSILKKSFMYKFSCRPSVILYVAENKTLAGKEDRAYEGEAMGRKLAVVFFENAEGGLVQRVDREGLGMNLQLLTLAEILQTIGGFPPLPADPDRTAANTELLLESLYQNLEIQRWSCITEPHADDVHKYTLENEVNAEASFALELSEDQRTKMVLSRCLQRHGEFLDDETLQTVWNLPLAELKARAAHLFPVPAAPPALAPPVPLARGRARGRGGPVPAAPPALAPPVPLARGRARGRGGPVAPAIPPAARGGRGRGRGRGR